MTWLDVGNGWRNLYLLSVMLQAFALGTWCALCGFPLKKNRLACFLGGVAVTPLIEYLWMLLMAFAWKSAPRLVLIGVPPVLAGISLLIALLVYRRRLPQGIAALRDWAGRIGRMDRSTVFSACFALAMVILLLPACIRMMSSMATISGGDSGEYMGLALRWCEDRDLGKLLEKEELVGHFRGHSHFPSLELYMSYGLLHTGGTVGYPFDKAAFTGLGLLLFFAMAAYGALLLAVCGDKKRWIAPGVLCFNLVPSLYESALGAPRDIWRILGLLWIALCLTGMDEKGGAKRYLLKLVFFIAACFTVQSTHVVCFVVLPLLVVAWVVWRWLRALLYGEPAGKALGRSVGLAFGGAVGVLAGFSGNLWCVKRWGTLSPYRLMDTFSEAPWYDLYMQKEYKLQETTTTVNFFQSKQNVLMTHATPIGLWGLRLAVLAAVLGIAALIVIRVRRKKALQPNPALIPAVEPALWCALMVLLTMLPVTGLLDSPLYSFSGAFLKMSRYTLQWYLLCGVMFTAFGAAVHACWPMLKGTAEKCLAKVKHKTEALAVLRRVPALACAAVCVLLFVSGIKQTGYSESFFRLSRNTMEDESILLDNGFCDRYELLMQVNERVPEDEKLLITRVGYQYPLRGEAYLIAANNIVSILNLPESDIEQALRDLNVAAVASEPTFWDNRYFGQSTLSDWLNKLLPERIIETETMRVYLVSDTMAERCADLLISDEPTD